jgi:large subunit ribosomal protein L10
MPTAKKAETIASVTEALKGATAVIVSRNAGLNSEEVTELRKQMRAANVTYKVVKNTLAARAAKEAGIVGLDEYLSGPTAIAISKGDIVAPAKILHNFAKEHEKLTIVGGIIDGKPSNAAEVASFASLPSKEEVIAMLLRTINGPVAGLARVINGWVEKRQAAEGGAPAA